MHHGDAASLTEKKPAKRLASFLNTLAAVTLTLLMIITCVDVFGRYFFNSPLTGSTELTEMSLAIVVFAGFPVISWRNEHVVVDILDKFIPPAVDLVRTLLINVVSAAALLYIGQNIYKLALRSMKYGEVSEYLHIPTGWVIVFIAVMCWLSAVMLMTIGNYRTYRLYRVSRYA